MSKEIDGQTQEHQDAIYIDGDLNMYEEQVKRMLEVDEVDTRSQSIANITPVVSSSSLNEANSSSKGNTKPSKSVVWNEMTRKISKDGVVQAICNHCTKVLGAASKNGTKHLHNHLARCSK